MTWEVTENRRFPAAPFYVALVFLLLVGFSAFFKEKEVLPPETRCEQAGGEWLYGSKLPTCITAEGKWLTYDEVLRDFVSSAGRPVPLVASAKTADDPADAMNCSGSFAVHAAEEISISHPLSVDFSSWPEAATYRSAISKDVKRGVNYAGHYIVSSWGCPQFENCTGYSVIDALDGKILSFGETSYGRPRYLLDSRLLEVELENGSKTYLLNEESKTLEQCK